MYVHEMEVLGAARKAVSRVESPRPIGAVCDLWVGLDVSERCMRT